MDTERICRTCQSEEELTNIFDKENKELIPSIVRIACIIIKADDKLPKYICHSCARTIRMIHKFIQECQKTDRILRDRLQRLKTIVEIEPLASPAKSVLSKPEAVDNKHDIASTATSLTFKTESPNDEEKQLPTNPHQEIVQQQQPNDTNPRNVLPTIPNPIPLQCPNDPQNEDITVKVEPIEEIIVESALDPPNPYFIMIADDSEDENSNEQCLDEVGKFFNLDDIIEVDADYVEQDYVNLVNYIDEHTEVSKTSECVTTIAQPEPTPESPNEAKTCDSPISSQPEPVRRSKKIRKHKRRGRPPTKPKPTIEEKKSYVCCMCSATFQNCLEYRKHRREHGDSLFPCKICNKSFKSTYRLNLHQNIHFNIKFPCRICGMEFSSPNNMRRHILKVHEPCRTEKCDVCVTLDGTPHDSGHVCKFVCSTCGKEFKKIERLKIHERTHDPNFVACKCGNYKKKPLQEFICEKCGKVCKGRPKYLLHLNVHTDCRRFECSKCPAKFKSILHLKKHMLCHTNEKPYSCNECGKRFRQSAHLKTHIKSIHAPVSSRPFVCKFCDKRHVSLQNLRAHERVHTGERPYICDICGESFKEISPLRRHRQKVHLIMEPSKRSIIQAKGDSVHDSDADKLNTSSEYVVDVEGVMDTFKEIVEYEL